MSDDKHTIDIDNDNNEHLDKRYNSRKLSIEQLGSSSSKVSIDQRHRSSSKVSFDQQGSSSSKLSTDQRHRSNSKVSDQYYSKLSTTNEIDTNNPTYERSNSNSKRGILRVPSDLSNSISSSKKSLTWEDQPKNNNNDDSNKNSNKSNKGCSKKTGLFKNIKKNFNDRILNINNYIDDWRQGIFKIKLVQESVYNTEDIVYYNEYKDNTIMNRTWKIITENDDKTYDIESEEILTEDGRKDTKNNISTSKIYKKVKYELDFKQMNRVASATMYIFFTQAIPAITFASLANEQTNHSIGVTEVLFSMGIGGSLFAITAGQPLVVVGVTGPVCIFIISLYHWSVNLNLNFIGLLFWTCFWSCVFCILSAILNFSELFEHTVTNFSCDSFGFLIGVIYIYEGIFIFVSLFDEYDIDAALLSLLLGLGCLYVGNLCCSARTWNNFNKYLRNFIADYGAVIVIIAFTAFQFLPKFSTVSIPKLNIPKIFNPSYDRPWLNYDAWTTVGPKGIFVSVGMGLVLSILLYFDHNVSSALSQSVKFKLKKPSSYDYDFFILGISVFICGTLGIIPNYGLLPQAPLHVRSLATIRIEQEGGFSVENVKDVIETRWSALLQSALMFVLLAKPLLYLISLIPLGVIAGVFIFLGLEGLKTNSLTGRLLYIFMDEATRYIGERNRLLQKLKVNIERWKNKKIELTSRGDYGKKVSLLTNKLKYYETLLEEENVDIDSLKLKIDEMDEELDEILGNYNIDDTNSEFGNRSDAGSIPDDSKETNDFSSIEVFEFRIMNDFRGKYRRRTLSEDGVDGNCNISSSINEGDSSCNRQSESGSGNGSSDLDAGDDFEKHHINIKKLSTVSDYIIKEYEGIKSEINVDDDLRPKLYNLTKKIDFYQSLESRRNLCNEKSFREDDRSRISKYFKDAIDFLKKKKITTEDIKKYQKTFEKCVDRITDSPEKIDWQRLDFSLLRRYTLIQFALTMGIFGIALSSASFIFPVFIISLVPFRLYVLPLLLMKGNALMDKRTLDNFSWKSGIQNEFLSDVDSNLVVYKE